jgi:glycosyltransferase involved in cell wall biosynthesis
MNKMIMRAAQLRISDKFHFTGFLKGNDVSRMFQLSDVYIMPSVSEPFGISPLEAMQAGVPVIISHQSGVAEIISNAIKVNYWDVDAMADAIHGILMYPRMSKMLSRYGRKESCNLNWKDSAHRVNQVYKSAISA